MKPPPCSCRGRMVRRCLPKRVNAWCSGMLAPPGYAKMTSTPWLTRHCTKISAPDCGMPDCGAADFRAMAGTPGDEPFTVLAYHGTDLWKEDSALGQPISKKAKCRKKIKKYWHVALGWYTLSAMIREPVPFWIIG